MKLNRSAVVLMSLLLVVLGALVTGTTVAGAQEYPPTATLTVNDPNPVCGETVEVRGTGFAPNATVTISIGGHDVGTAQTDAEGNFTFPYTLPDPCDSGEQIIRATDGTTTLLVTISVSSTTVTTATTATGNLPRTGSSDSTLRLAQIGILLVAFGGILLMATRKRRQPARTDV